MAWLVVEDTKDAVVELLYLPQVLDFDAGEDVSGRVIVEVYTPTGLNISTLVLKDWNEFEKFINMLPAIDAMGWIYLRDGEVKVWKGRLKILDDAGKKELTKEEENAVLEGGE